MANHKNLILSLSLEKEIMSAFLIDGSVQRAYENGQHSSPTFWESINREEEIKRSIDVQSPRRRVVSVLFFHFVSCRIPSPTDVRIIGRWMREVGTGSGGRDGEGRPPEEGRDAGTSPVVSALSEDGEMVVEFGLNSRILAPLSSSSCRLLFSVYLVNRTAPISVLSV
ncbi:hypothetical protein OUZ56_001232 [Daphnia magna]|uniref:Uncharacterized protein n=1 Tax=Daphnia magna TaxID=35525 RepID=A0ABR0A212_9CRUS|nr:hypothetical protein OUZ56_001232 [Daphnia magna]